MSNSQPQEPGHRDRDAPAAASPALVLRRARLADGRTVDVRLADGRIEAVGAADSLSAGSARLAPRGAGGAPAESIDLTGYLLLPAPAESHAHYDTTLAPDTPHSPRPPDRAPGNEDLRGLRRRATEAALLQLGHGATALRTHVHVAGNTGMRCLQALLEVRRALQGLAELAPVALSSVLTGAAGANGLAALRDAAAAESAVVGCCPDLDPNPVGCAEAALAVAAEHNRPLDVHTHGDDPVLLARIATAAGALRPGATIGPCAGLARLPAGTARWVADRLAATGVIVVCLPQGCNVPKRRFPVRTAPVGLLRSAGVRVAAASGAPRGAADPVGRGDPLETARLLVSLEGLGPRAAYAAISDLARAAVGLPEVRVAAGFPAELLAVRGDSVSGALASAYSRIVVHRGRVVARTSAVREYCRPAAPPKHRLPRQSSR